MSRYECWRSRTDPELHLICGEGKEAFEQLPDHIRNLGPWQGSKEGAIADLRLPYRPLLAEQPFLILHCHVSELDLEARGIRLQVAIGRIPTVTAPAMFRSTVDFGRRTAGDVGAEAGCRPKR